MKKINKHIAVVRSSDIWLSSLSQVSCDGIVKLLKNFYQTVEVIVVNSPADLQKIVLAKPDLVFMGMKFVPHDSGLGLNDPNKIWLSDFLDEHQISYTGSNQIAHELELNKHFAKQRVRDHGINTSNFYVRDQAEVFIPDSPLIFPLFIKPTNRGGGLGIDSDSIVNNYQQLEAKVLSISLNHGSDSLIEEFLPGREFSVAILKDRASKGYFIMPLELVAPKDASGARILSQEVKAADTEDYLAVTNPIIKKNISELAMKVFDALGARDYGRIDIRLNEAGVPQFLEANLLPSLLDGYGNFPKACLLNLNLSYADMILEITKLGFKHTKKPSTNAVFTKPSKLPALKDLELV
jgi:D-alanine-D-alanine ligase